MITLLLLVCASMYMGVVLRAHSISGEPRIQRNDSRKVATTSPPFSTNCTDRTFFL